MNPNAIVPDSAYAIFVFVFVFWMAIVAFSYRRWKRRHP